MLLSAIYVVDKNGRLEVLCNGEGVLLVEAETDSTLQDIGLFNQSLDLSQLMPTLDYSGDISSVPLILVQVSFVIWSIDITCTYGLYAQTINRLVTVYFFFCLGYIF